MDNSQFWGSVEEKEPDLSAKEKALRDAFVREYLDDYNPVKACVRLGYKLTVAQTYATRFMEEPYVLKKISELQRNGGDVGSIIKSGLTREANFYGAGSSHGARVTALAQLSKIEGMEKSAASTTNINQAVFHLTKENISKLDDEDLDKLVAIFSKMSIAIATAPEVAQC